MSMKPNDTPNPYGMGTPEWQLFENMKQHRLNATSAHADADRSLSKAADYTAKAEAYAAALAKIDPAFQNPWS